MIAGEAETGFGGSSGWSGSLLRCHSHGSAGDNRLRRGFIRLRLGGRRRGLGFAACVDGLSRFPDHRGGQADQKHNGDDGHEADAHDQHGQQRRLLLLRVNSRRLIDRLTRRERAGHAHSVAGHRHAWRPIRQAWTPPGQTVARALVQVSARVQAERLSCAVSRARLSAMPREPGSSDHRLRLSDRAFRIVDRALDHRAADHETSRRRNLPAALCRKAH